MTACEAITVASGREHHHRDAAPSSGTSRKNGFADRDGSSQDQGALAEVVDDQRREARAANQARGSARRPKWPMSAYSASAPVIDSTTAPIAMNAVYGWSATNVTT